MSKALASVKYYVMFFKIIIKKKKIKITLNLSIYAIYFLVLYRVEEISHSAVQYSDQIETYNNSSHIPLLDFFLILS